MFRGIFKRFYHHSVLNKPKIKDVLSKQLTGNETVVEVSQYIPMSLSSLIFLTSCVVDN